MKPAFCDVFPLVTLHFNNSSKIFTLMDLTRFAVLLAISLAAWTKCFFATGLFVLDEAALHTLQRFDVCLATAVADCKIYNKHITTHFLFHEQRVSQFLQLTHNIFHFFLFLQHSHISNSRFSTFPQHFQLSHFHISHFHFFHEFFFVRDK